MHILITGADGQLAKSIIGVYSDAELTLTTKNDLDVTDKEMVDREVAKINPDIIFHFASITKGDECAQNPDTTNKVNVIGTQNITDACRNVGATMLFVSTNEVFDGSKKSPYIEFDILNPITVVGKSKLEAEKIIRQGLEKYFIVRTSWLYNKQSCNFLHSVFKKAVSQKEVTLVNDEISSPTYSLDLARAIKQLIELGKYGTYHLVNDGVVSRLQFAEKFFELYGLKDINVIPVCLSDFQRLSMPPLFSPLENIEAKKFGIVLPSWEDALTRFLNDNDSIDFHNL